MLVTAGGARGPAWNNGKEVPRWGVAEPEIQKIGDVIVVTNSPPIGHMRSQLTNHQVGIVLDVQAWSENYIRRPDMVERIGSYLGTSFPLFHGAGPLSWLSSSRKVADQMKTINLNRRFDGSSAIVPSPQTANI